MDEKALLVQFTGPDDREAERAFEKLKPLAERHLHNHLKQKFGCEEAGREDIILETLFKVWSIRRRFRNQGVGAWYRFLQVTASRLLISHLRSFCQNIPTYNPLTMKLPTHSGLVNNISVEEHLTEEIQRISRCADILWLELDANCRSVVYERQLLAAQLFYLEGRSWDHVIRLVYSGENDEPLTRERLDSWLNDLGVLRLLIYTEIYFPDESLLWYFLFLDQPLDPVRLYDLFAASCAEPPTECAPDNWTWPEVRALFWKYFCGYSEEQILHETLGSLTREELSFLFRERCAGLEPFTGVMKIIMNALSGLAPAARTRVLTERGLWKRLAFQYWYFDELPQKEIHARMNPAALEAGYEKLTSGALNMWLSGGRLIDQLKQTLQNEGTSPDDGR